MNSPLFTDEDLELWLILSQARDAVFRAREKELKQYGASVAQVGVLFFIKTIGDKATPAKISRWLFRKSHGVSALLNRMEKEGLVKRVKDLDKKNLVRIAITEKGYQTYLQSTKRESIHRIMSSLPREEHQQLRSLLTKLRDMAFEELRIDSKPQYPPSHTITPIST